MNEKLSPMQNEMLSRADAIFAWVSEAAKSTGEFAKEQAPDIAMQFIAYGRFTSTTGVIAGVLFCVLAVYIAIKYFKESEGLSLLVAGLPALPGVLFISFNFKAFAMSWFAPKLYLITEIVKLLK